MHLFIFSKTADQDYKTKVVYDADHFWDYTLGAK